MDIPQGSPTKQDPPLYFFVRSSGRSDAERRLSPLARIVFLGGDWPRRERDFLKTGRSAAEIYVRWCFPGWGKRVAQTLGVKNSRMTGRGAPHTAKNELSIVAWVIPEKRRNSVMIRRNLAWLEALLLAHRMNLPGANGSCRKAPETAFCEKTEKRPQPTSFFIF